MSNLRKSLWRSVLGLRCPRCREGRVFRSLWAAHAACPTCGLAFAREPGYWLGAMYVSYGFAAVLTAPCYVAGILGGWPLSRVLLACAILLACAAPWMFRYARVVWLHLDRWMDPV